MENTGLIYAPIQDSDRIAGDRVHPILSASGDYRNHLPSDEKQRLKWGDTSGCVSFSALNAIEIIFDILYPTFPDLHKKFLIENGYCDLNGHRWNFSDRFTHKKSGTTKEGNYQVSVGHSIRNDGLVTESDWSSVSTSWEDYTKSIPPEITNKGLAFAKMFDISYEWVSNWNMENLRENLKYAPIQLATHLTSSWSTGDVQGSTCLPYHHAYLLYNVDEYYRVLDHYEPFLKRLNKDYCVRNALQYFVKPKEVVYYVSVGEKWYVEPIAGKTKTLVRLNYRTQPIVNSSTLVGTLPIGTEIEILEYVGMIGGFEWVKINRII